MASCPAHLIDAKQNGVAVAIDVDGLDELDVAAFLALAPQLLSAATVVDGPTRGQRLRVALGVHIGHHQDFAGGGVLGNDGQQAVAAGEVRARGGCLRHFRSFSLVSSD